MRLLVIILLAVGLSACSTPRIEDYAGQQPSLDLRDYFNGELEAWGMFQNRSGQVIKRFHVAMTGTWQGDVGTLDERFTYSDGSTERRVWTLRRQADGSWRGTAADVAGEAVGEVAGNALHWRYQLRLPVDGEVYLVSFDDWMWQQDQRVMINRARMSKWGVTLGEVTLAFMRKASAD